MDISFDAQTEVLGQLFEARRILRESKHDRLQSDFKKAQIIEHITACFHDVQVLDTQPY